MKKPKSSRARHVRRSVTLPAKIARQVESLARQRDLSDNRVLVELIDRSAAAKRESRHAAEVNQVHRSFALLRMTAGVGGTVSRRQRSGAGQAVGRAVGTICVLGNDAPSPSGADAQSIFRLRHE